jgi:hypothetical protein
MIKPLILELNTHSAVQEIGKFKCTAHNDAAEQQKYLSDIQCQQVNTHKNCAGVYWNISVSG